MSFLLDTDILSAIRRKQRDPNLEKWLRSINSTDIFLSVVTLGEVERGIALQRRINPTFSEDLERWLDTILLRYEQRILPLFEPTQVSLINPYL